MASIFDTEDILITHKFIESNGFQYDFVNNRFKAIYLCYRPMESQMSSTVWYSTVPANIYINRDHNRNDWEIKVQYPIYDEYNDMCVRSKKYKHIAHISTEFEFKLAWKEVVNFCDNLYKQH